jgi:hypothetical protein
VGHYISCSGGYIGPVQFRSCCVVRPQRPFSYVGYRWQCYPSRKVIFWEEQNSPSLAIFYNGESLLASKMTIIGFVVFTVVVALTPLCSVMPQLIRAKREGLGKYSAFASRYVLNFDQRWLQGKTDDEQLLGSGDIQSLADLSNSFEVARGMRLLPISTHDVVLLFVVTVAPFLPLLLTIRPLEQLLMRAMKIIF